MTEKEYRKYNFVEKDMLGEDVKPGDLVILNGYMAVPYVGMVSHKVASGNTAILTAWRPWNECYYSWSYRSLDRVIKVSGNKYDSLQKSLKKALEKYRKNG